jgi:GTP-binding protein HflX
MTRIDSVDSEAAFLVGVHLEGDEIPENPLEELEGLATAAGTEVVGTLTQRRRKPDTATYLGRGKVDELKHLVSATETDLIIFDNDLSPGQTRNLEQTLDVKVLDRTELILDIFANRARTHEARLAVELAQLEYAMPRLRRMWTHLSRQKKGGVGLRGPGEKQLEVDRRLAQKRIADLRSQLDHIHQRRRREVSARKETRTVSLVGYTNAGKSTLLNALTNAEVLTQDALFATLDTRTRRWFLPGWGPVLLSDTVGFVRELPHHLIACFRATLEEARQADLLMHVADASHPSVADQITAAYGVLEDIGIEEKDTLLVLNKIDAVKDPARIESLKILYPRAIFVSAHSQNGFDPLAKAVSNALSREFRNVEVEMPVWEGKIAAYLAAKGEVLSRNYDEEKVIFHCRLPEEEVGRIQQAPHVDIRERGESSGEEIAETR